nr:MAG TPA: hypothetical protein [Caudoviricetes sp.]
MTEISCQRAHGLKVRQSGFITPNVIQKQWSLGRQKR